MRRAAAIGACIAALAAPLRAEVPAAQAAEAAAEALRAASVTLEAAAGAEDRIAALTETVRAYEAGLAVFRQALRDAALRERALRARFEDEAARLGHVLGALQTMGRAPEATVLLHPSGALGTARASALMAHAVPALSREAEALRADLEELRILSLLREQAFDTLSAGLEGAQAARTELSQAVQERRRDEIPPTDAAALAALLGGAETLDAFASTLSAGGGGDAGAPAAFETAKGELPVPVEGILVTGFNEPDMAGVERPGLSLATAARAVVTAPWPATVRFSGPFLDYGNVIVLEPEAGYLLVLAGLGESLVGLGQVVKADEAIGLMGGQPPGPEGILSATAGGPARDRPETLYVELRSANVPQDPAQWFALGKE